MKGVGTAFGHRQTDSLCKRISDTAEDFCEDIVDRARREWQCGNIARGTAGYTT